MAIEDLTSLAEVKDFLLIDVTTWDSFISKLITRVSKLFDSYCRRPLKARDLDKVLDGNGTNTLWLPTYPINSITKLWLSKDQEWTSANEISANNYYVNVDTGRLRLTKGDVFPDYPDSVRIQFNGGYSTVPADLEEACIEEVARRFHFSQEKQLGRLSESTMAGATTYEPAGLLRTVRLVLDLYKDWRS